MNTTYEPVIYIPVVLYSGEKGVISAYRTTRDWSAFLMLDGEDDELLWPSVSHTERPFLSDDYAFFAQVAHAFQQDHLMLMETQSEAARARAYAVAA